MEANLSSHVELYDSDVLAIDKGPVSWMAKRQNTRMDLESFRKAVIDKFAEVGFKVIARCYETTQSGVYAFDVEICARLDNKFTFDYDKMVHEVTNNLLDEPGVEKGFIKAPSGAEARRIAALKPHKH